MLELLADSVNVAKDLGEISRYAAAGCLYAMAVVIPFAAPTIQDLLDNRKERMEAREYEKRGLPNRPLFKL